MKLVQEKGREEIESDGEKKKEEDGGMMWRERQRDRDGQRESKGIFRVEMEGERQLRGNERRLEGMNMKGRRGNC